MIKNIFIIRHGESEGNANPAIYKDIPDYAISLSKKGIEQSLECGKRLKELLTEPLKTIYLYSPFFRARETMECIAESVSARLSYPIQALVEQDWGRPEFDPRNKLEERSKHGVYYYKFENGESPFDVEMRLAPVIQDLFKLDEMSKDIATDVVIVCHGMTMRVLAKILMKWDLYTFEECKTPKNCEIWQFEKIPDINQFRMISNYSKRKTVRSPCQYKTLKERNLI